MNRTIFVSRRQTHSLNHCEFMQKKRKKKEERIDNKTANSNNNKIHHQMCFVGKMKCENILKMILMMIWVCEHGYILDTHISCC